MTSNAYAIASPKPSATATKREVAAVFGYEDARIAGELLRTRVGAHRARRKSDHLLADEDDEPRVGPSVERRDGRNVERNMDFLADPAAHEAQLPSGDLLKHIFQHTTHLYSQPHSGGIGKKLLDQDAWEAFSARRRKAAPRRADSESDSGEDELDSAGGDESDGSMRTAGSRRSSRSARSLRRNDSRASVASGDDAAAGRRKTKRKGAHEVHKNMHKALTGDTLIALGILVEEFVKHTVDEAGYPDLTGGSLYLDAASDSDSPGDGGRAARAAKVVRLPDEAELSGSGGEEEDDVSSSSGDEDDDEERSSTSSGTDSSSGGPARRAKSKDRQTVNVKEEQRQRRRLFRAEEDRYQEMLESGVAMGEADSESDDD